MGVKKYVPASKNPFNLETVTPENMAFEVAKALQRLQQKYGDLDLFVSRKLQYRNRQELFSKLAGEQIDAVAMAIDNIERGEGIIIGDMTGIGKGRIAAALIRYGILNKKPVVFISEKSNLFSDMYRDLYDIGFEQAVPFVFNNDKEATLTIEIEDEDTGEMKITPLSMFMKNKDYDKKSNDLQRTMLEGRTTLPDGYDFLMTTYSQLSNDNFAKELKSAAVKAKTGRKLNWKASKSEQFKTKFLREYVDGGIIIMDESHNAGGAESNIGYYLRDLLSRSAGSCYLSATYAKRSDNMPLYAIKTSIKKANLRDVELMEVFEKGGVPLQEIVASELVSEGQMLRRQRTYDGIPFDYDYLDEFYDEHKETFNKVAAIVREIIGFQRDELKPLIKETNGSVSSLGQSANVTTGTNDAGTANVTEVFNTMHLLVGQLLFALKAKEVALRAVERLNKNQKVVIAFARTMGSYLDEAGYVDGEAVENLDFALVLERLLKSTLKYTVKDKKGASETMPIDFDSLPESAKLYYNAILDKIKEASIGISLSPIDVLINTIEAERRPVNVGGKPHEFYKVRECTGRSGRVVIDANGIPRYRRFKADKKTFFSEFNNGYADVLLINQSASTGVSCHSSAKFEDIRKRVMLIHEAELDINKQVQKLGRIYRSGMVTTINEPNDNLPEYLYVSSSIPAEKRLFMVLKQKLKSLDANTTGSQRSSEDVLQVEDFFNKYGAFVIKQYLLEENTELLKLLGKDVLKIKKRFSESGDDDGDDDDDVDDDSPSLTDDDSQKKYTANERIVNRVTNRVAIMDVEVQETFYNDVMERYLNFIDELKQADEYDLEVEFLDFQAVTKKRSLFVQGKGNTNAFDCDAILEDCEVKVLRKPMKWSEVQDIISKTLKKDTPQSLLISTLNKFEKQFKIVVEKEKEIKTKEIDKLKGQILSLEKNLAKLLKKNADATLRGIALPVDDDVIQEAEDHIEKQKGKLSNKEDNNTLHFNDLENRGKYIRKMLEWLEVEKPVLVAFGNGDERVFEYGIITNVNYLAKAKNAQALWYDCKIDIALASPKRLITKNLQQIDVMKIMDITDNAPRDMIDNVTTNWNALSVSNDKQRVNIATKNIMLALNKGLKDTGIKRAKLIKYTDSKNRIINGILVSQSKDGHFSSSMPVNQAEFKSFERVTAENAPISFEKRYGDEYLVYLPDSKIAEKFYKDSKVIELLTPNYYQRQYNETPTFSKRGKELIGEFNTENFKKLLDYLSEQSVSVATKLTDYNMPDEVEEPESDVSNPVDASPDYEQIFWYILPAPFKPNEYPNEGFVEVMGTLDTDFGVIGYLYKLSPQRKVAHSLKPYFENASEIVAAWYHSTDGLIRKEINDIIDAAKANPDASTALKLGNYIFNHSPDFGNPEFYFGNATKLAMGKVLMKMFNISLIEDMKIYIKQLEIATQVPLRQN